MKHCCVIGGGGFIGGHVVEKLVARQRRVTIIDTNPTPSGPVPDGVNYVIGDYGEKSFIEKALRDVDEIIHLAYSTVPKTSFDDPLADISENLPATVTLLEAACSVGVEKFILMSSGGTVYGKVDKVPICEEHPTNPISPYGITKLATEKYAIMYGELKGLAVIRIRPGNAYGEGQRPFVGQGFIATAIGSVLRRQEVTIFGQDGTVRDYIHACDIAEAITRVLERGGDHSCYNVGTGIGQSNKDVLAAIVPLAESEGLEVRVKTAPLRPFDVPVNVLDSSRLTADTGWKPAVAFKEGIAKTWKWVKTRQHSF